MIVQAGNLQYTSAKSFAGRERREERERGERLASRRRKQVHESSHDSHWFTLLLQQKSIDDARARYSASW